MQRKRGVGAYYVFIGKQHVVSPTTLEVRNLHHNIVCFNWNADGLFCSYMHAFIDSDSNTYASIVGIRRLYLPCFLTSHRAFATRSSGQILRE